MWDIQTVDLNRKEILTHAKTWMNLEDIMLSEISLSQKDECCKIPLLWGNEYSPIHRDRKQSMVARAWRRDGEEEFVI